MPTIASNAVNVPTIAAATGSLADRRCVSGGFTAVPAATASVQLSNGGAESSVTAPTAGQAAVTANMKQP